MKKDNGNLFAAIGLSLLVVFAWQYFYASPQMEKARVAHELTAKQVAAEKAAAPVVVPGAPAPVVNPEIANSRSRAEALADGPRIRIDTPKLAGSIALKGARLDDVSLKAYHETIDPKSPNIVLFSPAGTPDAFFAETGFVPQPGADAGLPGRDTVWTADGDTLTAVKPVTLTYDSGKGLVFTRKIAVDDQYLFTISDTVENKGTAPAGFYAHSDVQRQGHPALTGYAVLHEGLVGVAGESKLQEITYA